MGEEDGPAPRHPPPANRRAIPSLWAVDQRFIVNNLYRLRANILSLFQPRIQVAGRAIPSKPTMQEGALDADRGHDE
jgi:hypothetical protein